MNKKPIVICSAFVVKDNKILIYFCPKFKLWRVPGGRVEFGEILEDTLIREIKEELGVTIRKQKFIGFGQDNHYNHLKQRGTSRLIMFFQITINGKLTFDKTEIQQEKWVTLNELKKIKDKEGALTDFFKRFHGFSI